MTNSYKTLLIFMICAVNVTAYGQELVSTTSLLKQMIDYNAVAKWPVPAYTEAQASSYDRHSVAPGKPGWFANADASQYIRTETNNGREEKVMMDVDGPGAIVRFWLTTFKRAGNIRIYFDNKTEPELTIPAYDLMQSGLQLGKGLLTPHSSYEATQKGGSNLYLPMPYAKHCKITFEDKEPGNEPRYYQVNYRTYPAGMKVRTFTLGELRSIQDLTQAVNEKLMHPYDPSAEPYAKVKDFYRAIQPQNQAIFKLPQGPMAVRYLSIKITTANPADQEQALRSTVLKMYFDDQQTVWCPVGDFSGSGVGGKFLHSWYRDVDTDGKIISRWVMPYQASATLSLINTGDKPVTVSVILITDKWKWDGNSLYFHADWKSEQNVSIKRAEEDKPIEWDLNVINGKGLFMGDTFAVYNHMHKWYGEGDQKLWIDGQTFPAEFGTGTEDYYNTSWAPVVLYQTSFANAPRADTNDSFGHNTFTRTRILDAVPFTTSFRFSLEMLGWKNGSADLAATTYWYGTRGAKSTLSSNQTQPTKLPGN